MFTDSPMDQKHFDYTMEMADAIEKGTLAAHIKEEQNKVLEADLVIFQFPIQVWQLANR